MRTHFTYAKFTHMRQLHVKGSQLRHRVDSAENIFESFLGKRVVIAVGLFRSAAKVQLGQLLHSAQLLDSLVGDAIVLRVTRYGSMRTVANELELQIPVQRLPAVQQCFIDSFSSCGNVVSRSAILIQSSDWQPRKQAAVTVEEILVK
jgi:hypothetical protein